MTKKTDELVEVKDNALSTLPDFMKPEDAGMGVSTDPEDVLVPLIYVLQPLSPQVLKGNAKQVKGAEAGDIWLRGAAQEIIPGDEGVLFQPCSFTKDWVEWVPRDLGGGLVARHAMCPETAESHISDKGKSVWILPSGNEVIETRYHSGFVFLDSGARLPYVIPLSSTGHTVSKMWNSLMTQALLPDGRIMPSFACLYRLKTKMQTRKDQSWFNLDISIAGDTSVEPPWPGCPPAEALIRNEMDYARGKALAEAFNSGTKSAALDEAV